MFRNIVVLAISFANCSCYSVRKIHVRKGAAADGRNNCKEARRQEGRTEIQVPPGLGHPSEED